MVKRELSALFGDLLHTGHAKALSHTSERAFAPLLMPLHRGKGWDVVLEKHFQDVEK